MFLLAIWECFYTMIPQTLDFTGFSAVVPIILPASSIIIANDIKISSQDKRTMPENEKTISKNRLKKALYINKTSLILV